MKINYALVVYKKLDEDNIEVKHIACYGEKPDQSDADSLSDELSSNQEFGMVGDSDFEMRLIERDTRPDLFETFKIPMEINE